MKFNNVEGKQIGTHIVCSHIPRGKSVNILPNNSSSVLLLIGVLENIV